MTAINQSVLGGECIMAAFGTYNASYSPTIYGTALFNKDSIVDKTMLAFSMWRSTIKIGIYPLIDSEDDQIKYDKKNGLAVFLTPIKALTFAQILKDFIADPKSNHARGVPAGTNLITIEDPTRPTGFNKPNANPVIVIRKVNENGSMESSYAYEIKNDPNFSVKDFNEKTGAFMHDGENFKTIELNLIAMQLEEYAKAMTNAQSFAVVDTLYPVLDKIASKLGVDISQNSAYSTPYKNTSYFSSQPTPPNGVSNYTGNSLEKMVSDDDLPF